MDFLTSIDAAALRQLRHISARSHPLVLYRRPNDYSYSHAYSFPIVLQLFPGLQLSTLTVRDTYHEPGTQHDGFGDEAAYEMVEHLIKSDGFRESVYISTSDCFMQPNDFEAYPADKSPKVKETSNRDPQPSTWDKLMKQRDGMNSDAGVEMFRHTKDGRVPLRDEFENPAPLDDNPKFMATDPASMRTCSHMEDTGRREVIEVRVKRGQGADYSQTGECSTNYERGLHGFFKKRTWQQIKEQGLNVEVRDEDPAAWL